MNGPYETGWYDEKTGTDDNPPRGIPKEVPYHRKVLTKTANVQWIGDYIYLQLTRAPDAPIVKLTLKDAADLVEALRIALAPR
jgi:hypothetical protein